MKIPFILLFSIMTLSCQKWEVGKQSQQNLLVLNAQITPDDSLITVYLGKVTDFDKSKLKPEDLALENAEVFIVNLDNVKSVGNQLNFNSNIKKYQIKSEKVGLVAGGRYMIKANHNNQEVIAEFGIPDKVEEFKIIAQKEEKIVKGSLSWISPKPNMVFNPTVFAVSKNGNLVSQSFGTWDVDASSILKSVEKSESFKLNFTISNVGINPELKLEILTLDKTGLNYLESIRNSNDTPQLSQDFLDRFNSPSIRYSNVQNGLGVVMGYKKYNLDHKL